MHVRKPYGSPICAEAVSPQITFVPALTRLSSTRLSPSFFPVSDQMSAHQLRSDGWEEPMGWLYVERACA